MKIHLWGDMVGVLLQPEDEVVSYLGKILQVSVCVALPAAMQVFPGVPASSWLLLLGACWEVQLVCLAPHSAVLVESLLMGWLSRSLLLCWPGDPRSEVWWER